MDPRAKPFPVGTAERMDDLLKDRKLPTMRRERIQAVRLLAMGWTAPEVAEVVGCGHSTVERHKRRYLADGEDYLLRTEIGGRRNALLSLDEERALLSGLAEHAAAGQLVSANAVKDALEQRVDRSVSIAAVYALMHRNGWTVKAPRPTHPDGDPARREAFKQTSQP